MDKNQKSFIENGPSFLMHYNHNHDKLGRFAKSNGSSGSSGMRELDSNSKEGKAFIREGKRAVAKDKIKKAFYASPSDLLYGAINKIDSRKHAKKRKEALLKASEEAAKSLASSLRKHESDEIEWVYAHERGDTQLENKIRTKYESDIKREIANRYDMDYSKDMSPTEDKSLHEIIKEDIDTAFNNAVEKNIYSKVLNKNEAYSIEQLDKMSYKEFNNLPNEKMPTKVTKRTDDFVKDYSTTDFGQDAKNSDIATYIKLQKEIEKRSVDWYNSEPKTQRTKAVYDKYKNKNANKRSTPETKQKFADELAGAVLKDLGYKDTPEARKRILESGAIIWD